MVVVRNFVKTNFYRDSVQLLHLSEKAKNVEGIRNVAVVMGTSTNKEILEKFGFLTAEGRMASANDMILAVMADSTIALQAGLPRIEQIVLEPLNAMEQSFHSIEPALEAVPDANLAVVSIPGESAREVVLKLLDKGLHVHLFSNHVPRAHEIEIKNYAKQKGLLAMGPGAGTTIIGGKAIGFANAVKNGSVGIVAAAGTGLQEVSVLLSEAGAGISQAVGVGGGDVDSSVGGVMTLYSIDALERDPQTEIILVVSKPPDDGVLEKIVERLAQGKKRSVTCFVGAKYYGLPKNAPQLVRRTRTLHAAAVETLRSANVVTPGFGSSRNNILALAKRVIEKLNSEQKYVRGLYTGGTLAYESLVILHGFIKDVYSNSPLDPKLKLPESSRSTKHSIIDLGEEEFTVGRAHPMIDPTIRKIRLVEEAKHPDVAVILLDFVLGYGSHIDPAGAMLDAIQEAKNVAKQHNSVLPMFAHLCGTEEDPQVLSVQTRKLEDAGLEIFQTNALMAITAGLVSMGSKVERGIPEGVWERFLEGF